MRTSDMALVLTELVESFVIAIHHLDVLICEFPLSHELISLIASPSILKE